ncbi:hypothetical protein J3B02_002308 [Coemansia erecta]|uniref:Endonuclease V n=1 Tax=Coemansia asiatica TaxID=1052880 RepID=A0A9W7XNU4_9FUNG|nr:hypothetical protein LPJ64_001305 [Coemansia asiatica]KAJ2855164.1 hypothetical protein J3B02_002308 [Coemansia erecta]KAJ2860613.1 hypothetical protein FB639_005612 [Coemansia asiatica]
MAAERDITESWSRLQVELSARRIAEDRVDFSTSAPFAGLRLVGGVDISYPRGDEGSDTAVVALTVLAFPSLDVLYAHSEAVAITAPYIPGFLAFRESAAYRAAFDRLRRSHPELWPQVVMVDGNGTLHPRRFGSACHVGVEMDVPTIGVAKNLLHIKGTDADAKQLKRLFAEDPELQEAPISAGSEIYGVAVAPAGESAKNPIFVSPGHRVSMRTAVELARCCSVHRVPEPIRVADLRSREVARQMEQGLFDSEA